MGAQAVTTEPRAPPLAPGQAETEAERRRAREQRFAEARQPFAEGSSEARPRAGRPPPAPGPQAQEETEEAERRRRRATRFAATEAERRFWPSSS